MEPSIYGPRTHFGQQPRSRGLVLAESVSARSAPNATFPHSLASGGFGGWASPGFTRRSKGILLGFLFLRLFICINFSSVISV
ncbi:hypothetical protein JTE90_005230 [Oedothorax gibbosus]|uniref:Uncharacterized protein n=1 Tax=Oedothorax gibbosus TaxID=931172 RepID=A0AAV6TD40_9ARAC|nr:hypothetical protein JTE90_005230 [Oedothorax gibbosus]